jgi:hypothetical protein
MVWHEGLEGAGLVSVIFKFLIHLVICLCIKSLLCYIGCTTCAVCLKLVGKTSLITRFMYDSFDNTYQVLFWNYLDYFYKIVEA